MKYIALILISLIMFSGCGVSKNIKGVERKPVGIVNMFVPQLGSTYSKSISYEPCWGNVVLGIVFAPTVIAPLYFFGFSCLNPIDTIKN
jgi:hypothetical protein